VSLNYIQSILFIAANIQLGSNFSAGSKIKPRVKLPLF